MRKAADHLGSASGAVVEDVSVAMHYEGKHEFFVKVLFKWRDSHRVVSQSIKLFIGQSACQACLAVLSVIQLVEDLPSVSFILVPLFFTFSFFLSFILTSVSRSKHTSRYMRRRGDTSDLWGRYVAISLLSEKFFSLTYAANMFPDVALALGL